MYNERHAPLLPPQNTTFRCIYIYISRYSHERESQKRHAGKPDHRESTRQPTKPAECIGSSCWSLVSDACRCNQTAQQKKQRPQQRPEWIHQGPAACNILHRNIAPSSPTEAVSLLEARADSNNVYKVSVRYKEAAAAAATTDPRGSSLAAHASLHKTLNVELGSRRKPMTAQGTICCCHSNFAEPQPHTPSSDPEGVLAAAVPSGTEATAPAGLIKGSILAGGKQNLFV
jgi:hypothetical protein